MTTLAEAVAIDLPSRLVRADDGRLYPVVELYDADGDETTTEKDAVTFVAGAGEVWVSGKVLHVPTEPLRQERPAIPGVLQPASGAATASRAVIQMTIDDAEHYTPEQRDAIAASYLPHERAARTKGIPTMGSGRVFPIADEDVTCKPVAIPSHWPQINGLDFGWDHPFAAVNLAWDRDADCIYVTKEYRQRESTPVIHAAAIKPWGDWIPCAWPHDGHQHDKGSGEALSKQYEAQGLLMLGEHATFEDGGYSLEAGVSEQLVRMQTGRWKVFATCGGWFDEFRYYHRKDGLIVKLRDDLLSASRVAMMMLRHAETKPRKDKLEGLNVGTVY